MAADESVKIIIEAEDQASAEFEMAQRRAEAMVYGTRDATEKLQAEIDELNQLYKTGAISVENYNKVHANLQGKMDSLNNTFKTNASRTKASAEFAGVLANTLGGTQFGAYAGQVAQITEKVSQFSEVSKVGGAGAMAFKAGLVGLVGVLSFQLGKALGDIIFQTKKWEEELAKATQKQRELSAEIQKTRLADFGLEIEELQAIGDETERNLALREKLKSVTDETGRVQANVQALQAIVDENAEWSWQFGQRKLNSIQKEEELKQAKESLAILEQEREVLQEMFSDRKGDIAARQKANEIAAGSDAYLASLRDELALLRMDADERRKAEAINNTSGEGAAGEAFQLMKERDAIIEKQKIEEDAANEKLANETRIKELRDSSLLALKQERIALLEGAEAAEVFALQQQGLDEATAKRIASEREALRLLREEKEKEKDVTLQADAVEQKQLSNPQLTAVESRLQTRGRTEDPTQKVAANTAEAVKQLQKLNENINKQQKVAPKLELEVVGTP